VAYPATLPTYTNPTDNNPLSAPNHAGMHTSENNDIIALATKVGVDSSTVLGSFDYRLGRIEKILTPLSLFGVKPTATAATNRDGIQSAVNQFQSGQQLPANLWFDIPGTYNVARSSATGGGFITGAGITVNVGPPVHFFGYDARSTFINFTSTTAGDELFLFAGLDIPGDFAVNRVHGGGIHNLSITGNGSPTRGVVLTACDDQEFEHFNVFNFGQGGMVGSNWTDSRMYNLGFDGNGLNTIGGNQYAAIMLASGFQWGCDTLQWLGTRLENNKRSIDIRSGAFTMSKVRFTDTKIEHHAVNYQDGDEIVYLDGTTGPGSVAFITFTNTDLTVSAGTISRTMETFFRAKSVFGLDLTNFYIPTGGAGAYVSGAWVRLENCTGPSLNAVRGNTGQSAARPPKGIVQLSGTTIGMNRNMDVEWLFRGGGSGSGGTPGTSGYGGTAPFAVTLDSGVTSTLTYAPSVVENASYPPPQ
jgi:hypothetical protein